MSEVVRYEPPTEKILVKVRAHDQTIDQAEFREIDGEELPPLAYEYNGQARVMGTPHGEWVRTTKSYVVGQRTTKQGLPIENSFFKGIREEWHKAAELSPLPVNALVTQTNNARMMTDRELKYLKANGVHVAVPIKGGEFIYPLTARALDGSTVEILKTMRDFSASASAAVHREIQDAETRLAKLKHETDLQLRAAQSAAAKEIEDEKARLRAEAAKELGVEEKNLQELRELIKSKKTKGA